MGSYSMEILQWKVKLLYGKFKQLIFKSPPKLGSYGYTCYLTRCLWGRGPHDPPRLCRVAALVLVLRRLKTVDRNSYTIPSYVWVKYTLHCALITCTCSYMYSIGCVNPRSYVFRYPKSKNRLTGRRNFFLDASCDAWCERHKGRAGPQRWRVALPAHTEASGWSLVRRCRPARMFSLINACMWAWCLHDVFRWYSM